MKKYFSIFALVLATAGFSALAENNPTDIKMADDEVLVSQNTTPQRQKRSSAYSREKARIQKRLRARYLRIKKLREARASRARIEQAKALRQDYFEEKSLRRKSLFSDGLQEERIRAELASGVLPSAVEGSARLEYRYFTVKPEYEKQLTNNISFLAEVETGAKFKNFELKIWNLARYDLNDAKRSGLLPYENWIGYITNSLQVKAGTQIENWAMTEVFAPSDVFNSRNLDSHFENSEKLGEPSVSARFHVLDAYATFYYMPYFMAPLIPSEESRLSALDGETKLLESKFVDNGKLRKNFEMATQYGARIVKKFGPADLTFHYLHHINRTSPFIGEDTQRDGARPIFLPVTQIGTNGSVVWGEQILKFDVVHRSFSETATDVNLKDNPISQEDHFVLALGAERTFPHKSGWDSMLFLEYQKYLGVSGEAAHRLDLMQHDGMFGYRLGLNDLKLRDIKAFVIVDLDNPGEVLWSLAYSQKLTTKIKISAGIRQATMRHVATRELDDADHVFTNLTYFF